MPNRMVLVVIAIIIMCTMLFGNKKVRVLPVLIKQLHFYQLFWQLLLLLELDV